MKSLLLFMVPFTMASAQMSDGEAAENHRGNPLSKATTSYPGPPWTRGANALVTAIGIN